MIARYTWMVLPLLICGGGFAVAQRCSFRATNIAFGNYTGAAIRMTGTLTISCTPGTLYAVGLDAGTGRGATVTNRSMTAGNDQLGYGLYSNASYTANWGNTPGTGWVVGIGTGNDQVLTVYGQVPANQLPIPGHGRSYNDNIVATLSGIGFSETARLRVTANVLDACSLSATSLAFGAYFSSQIYSTSEISVSCTDRTDYNVGLNAGTAPGATVTTRSMTGPGGALLHYRLYRNAARTLIWGDKVGGNTVFGTGNGRTQALTVYGDLPASQSAVGGSYSDTITVTITF